MIRTSILAAALLAAVPLARAESATITFTQQGYLLGADDRPVDGEVRVAIGLWSDDSATASNFLAWQDEWAGIRVAQGRYSFVLGDTRVQGHETKGFTPDLFARPLWMSIAIDGQALSPRIPFSLVPAAASALVAGDALKLGGREPSWYTDAANLTGTLSPQRLPLATDAAPGAITPEQKAAIDLLLNQLPCAAGEALSLAQDGLRCVAVVEAETDPKVGALSESRWCRSVAGQVVCDRSEPTLVEADPKVGALTESRWCRSVAGQVVCDRTEPTLTETDPKVGTLTANGLCTSDGAKINCSGAGPTVSPGGTLALAGGLRVGTDTTACTDAIAGSLRFNATSKRLEMCAPGQVWLELVAGDSTPDAFSFAAVTTAAPATVITSEAITPTGYTTVVDVTVSGEPTAQISVNGGAWSSGPLQLERGQTLRVRVTAGNAGTTKTVTVVAGNTSTTWTVTAPLRQVLTGVIPSSAAAPTTLGTIPAVPGKRIRIVRVASCGDSDAGSGPNQFQVTDGATSYTWETGQTAYGSTIRLNPLAVSSAGEKFNYGDVSWLFAAGVAVTMTWSYHADWDSGYCDDVDETGTSFNDSSMAASLRGWVRYQYE